MDSRIAEDNKNGKKYIILFDGTCKLCNNVVKFILVHDKKH